MYGFGGPHCSVHSRAREGCRSVRNYESGEAEISGHADRGRDAVIRGQSDNDERVDASLTQILLKARSDKGAVHILAVDGLGGFGGCNGLNRVAGQAWAQEATRFYGIVNDVADGPPAASPSREEPADVRFRVRIIPLAITRIEKCLLDINNNERCRWRKPGHGNLRGSFAISHSSDSHYEL